MKNGCLVAIGFILLIWIFSTDNIYLISTVGCLGGGFVLIWIIHWIRSALYMRKLKKLSNNNNDKQDSTLSTTQTKKIRQYTFEYHNQLIINAINLEIFLQKISVNKDIIKILNDTGEIDDTTHFLKRCIVHDLLQCVIFLQNRFFKKGSLEAFGFYVVMNHVLDYSKRNSEDWNHKYKWGGLKDDIQLYYDSYSKNPIGYAVTLTEDDKVLNSYKRISAFSIPTLLSATNSVCLKEYAEIIYRFATVIAEADGIVTEEEEKQLSGIYQLLHDPIPDEEQKNYANVKKNELTETHVSIENILAELNDLVGLQAVKEEINTLINFIKVQKDREKSGLKTSPMSYHIVFTGNPGTGKTTVARIVAKLYKHLGILSEGHLVETDRSGLIAEYLGQTAPKVNKTVNSALNGILFIDEAYALVGEDKDDFGREAVATLIKRMEDDRDKLVVILAGYTAEMETFINSNPGLQSRFNRYIEFPDYAPDELLAIFESKCKQSEYQLTTEALAKAKLMFERAYLQRTKSFGNARLVRNMFEKTIERQANRIAKIAVLTKDKLTTIEADDIL